MRRPQLLPPTSVWLWLVLAALCVSSACASEHDTATAGKPKHFEILSFQWNHVRAAYIVVFWIFVASAAKILFHVNKKFGDSLPDSACLIVVGLLLGYGLFKLEVSQEFFILDSTVFFLFMLPPIIFDAGYFMPSRQLFENLDSVMVFAFVGTILNTMAISATLYICSWFHLFSVEFSLFEILLFSSLISAVDPVAVIAVFEEVQVNDFLFIHVFGEALFNDGVTVVLYFMFSKFNDIDVLSATDYVAGGASFFVICFGGVLVGLFFAFAVSFITKFTDTVKIIAPVFIFTIPYMAYLTAEMFGLSSILAIVTCGIGMKEYVKGNVSYEANVSVKYFTKMLALGAETIIFMFLGLSTITAHHHFDWMFIGITIASCLIYRTAAILLQCLVLNQFRTKQFTYVDQFVMSYGGLRGAIAYGLAISMPAAIQAKSMFLTCTIAVIFFTVFVQGITIRPLLTWLNVELKEESDNRLIEKIYNRYFDYTTAGIEEICGQKGKNSVRDTYERFNAKVLKPFLMKSYERRVFDATKVIRAYEAVTFKDAMAIIEKSQKLTLPATPYTTVRSNFRFDPADIEQKLENKPNQKKVPALFQDEENVKAICGLINELFESRMQEVRTALENNGSSVMRPNEDIPDDYIGIVRPNFWSESDLTQHVSQLPGRQRSENLTSVRVQQPPVRRRSQPTISSCSSPDGRDRPTV